MGDAPTIVPEPDATATHYRDALIADLKSMNSWPIEITCDSCTQKNVCDYSFDMYNTNGDCIAEK